MGFAQAINWICNLTLMWMFIFIQVLSCLNLNLYVHNDIVSSQTFDKRDDFEFCIVNVLFLDDDVPRRPSYCVHISQLIHFSRASLHVNDFNNRNNS